jgi:predicted permease
MIAEYWQDLRYAARRLRRAPGFALLVVVTLGLGIGANVSIFTLVNAVLLRSLPVAAPERLVLFSPGAERGRASGGLRAEDGRIVQFSYPLYERLRQGTQGLALAAQDCNVVPALVRGPGADEIEDSDAGGRAVSANFFEVLGVPAYRGRLFSSASDGAPNSSAVVVLSHRYWQRRFGAEERLIGQSLSINGTLYTVAGVAAPGFTGATVGAPADLWVNLAAAEAFTRSGLKNEAPEYSWLQLFGRLEPSVTMEAAQANANVILAPFLLEHPTLSGGRQYRLELQPGATGFSLLRAEFREPLVVLMAGVSLLLLIVCLNVSHLLLARAMSREHEMSIRAALGATRARLARQLLVEGFLFALLGAFAGTLATRWLTAALLSLSMGDSDPAAFGLSIGADGRLFAFVAALALGTALLLGLVPAWHAWRAELGQSIRATSQAVTLGGLRRRASRALMISQVAFSLLLLTSAGLLAASLDKLHAVTLGLDREHVLLAGVNLSGAALDEERVRYLYEELPRRIGALPGVRAASLSTPSVLTGRLSRSVFFPGTARPDKVLAFYVVTPGYFEALGMGVVRGRPFSPRDENGAPLVAVVNETMAESEFGGRDALGQRISLDQVHEIEIVGVVSNARTHAVQTPPGPVLYLPAAQTDGALGRLTLSSLEVRGPGDPALLTDQVRRAVAEAQPGLPVINVRTLSEQIDRVLVKERVLATLAGTFGLGALFLVALGLYGVISQWSTQRTREIGVRMALGATSRRVQWLVLRQALMLVVAGLALGIPAALAVARLLEGLLFEVEPLEPAVLLAAALTLLSVASLAAYVPARRASRVDPVVALRTE